MKMINCEFIKYEPIQDSKILGIATVKLYDKVLLRYKIIPNKDGSGYFSACAYYRTSEGEDGKFLASFVIDSRSEEEEVNQIIRDGVRPFIKGVA